MKELLTSTLMYRLKKHRIQSKKMKRGFHKGSHRSTKRGTSLEFSDYRFYQPGDDLRQIDWNIFARTNKHYIKRFLDEQELMISIYVDCTKSMSIIPEKWNLTKGIAAALGYMSLTSDDRVGVFPVGSKNHSFSYKKGRAFANQLVQHIEEIKSNDEHIPFSEAIHGMIQPKSGVTFIISDLLEPIEQIEKALKQLHANKQELYVIQILAKEEIDPLYQGDLQLIDSESNEFLNVSMSTTVKRQYQQRLTFQTEQIQKFCHNRGIGFVKCQPDHSLEDIIFMSLTSKGWIQ